MMRSNEFEIRPRSEQDRELLLELLDASAALWNEVTYERRQRFFDDESIWETTDWYNRYKGVLGGATTQQVLQKNESAWKSFFSLLEDPDQEANLPGYWGNEEDGRTLRTYIRNTSYTLEWGERSRLEILIGSELKETYDRTGRLRLEAAGEPKWDGKQGQLEIVYDEVDDTFRAIQPVIVDDFRQDSPLAEESAALDVGANNLVACTTTTGSHYLYDGARPFEQFRETTERIAALQSKLDDHRRTSKRIDCLYETMYDRRNHAQDALVRDLVERLYEEGASTVYIGDIKDILEAHWKAEVNAKTHNFWAFRRFLTRLECVCEEYGIEVVEESESWTTQECPECGEREKTRRNGDLFHCVACGFEDHADLKASKQFLERETGMKVGLMAQPVCLEWDDHEWSETPDSPERARPKGDHTDRSTRREVGKVASVESA